ncbi:MAG: hypothetical protein AAGF20_07135 [Pseudomonadota bacterium]
MNEPKPDPKRQRKPTPDGPALEVDFVEFAHFLEDTDLSESQKFELLYTLWDMAVILTEIGFSVAPQKITCGQNALASEELTQLFADTLKCRYPKQQDNEADLSAYERFEKVTS